jgi:hypothetical protein
MEKLSIGRPQSLKGNSQNGQRSCLEQEFSPLFRSRVDHHAFRFMETPTSNSKTIRQYTTFYYATLKSCMFLAAFMKREA